MRRGTTRAARTLFGLLAGAVVGIMFAWNVGVSVQWSAAIGASILGVAGWIVDTR